MSVNTNQYRSPTSQDTSRAPSASIWGDCPVADLLQNASLGGTGVLIEDDFCPVGEPSSATSIGSCGKWASWSGSGSTITDGVEEGGVAKINGSTGGKSLVLTSKAGAFRFIGGSTNFNLVGGKFWMEFRVALGSIAASQQGLFIGLSDTTGSAINATDVITMAVGGDLLTVSQNNVFGFINRTTTSPADFAFCWNPASATSVYPAALNNLVNKVTGANMVAYAASTDKGKGTNFVKIGMVYDPTGDKTAIPAPASPPTGMTAGTLYKPLIQFYVNGQLHPQFLSAAVLQAATFPVNTVFSPVIQYINIAGATAPIYLDWVRFAQLATY